MRATFKKLEVNDIDNLEKLVAENVEGIEPGLKIIDSRLLLGQAAIDLVGLDAKGSLVLIALDFSADEGLLLRVMDAYSWCLEYPDTIRRLYPTARVSSGRPPRILFIVERLTDSFIRRIRQLSFLEIDCLEFRHLEVNGASAVYFDLVERLRKSVVEAPADDARETSEPPAPTARVRERRPVEPLVVQPVMEQRAVVERAGRLAIGPELAEHVADLLARVAAAPVEQPAPAPPPLELEAIEAGAHQVSAESSTSGSESVEPASEPLGVEQAVETTSDRAEPDAPANALPEEAAQVTAAVEAVEPAAAIEEAAMVAPEPVAPAPIQAPPVWAKPADKVVGQPDGGRTYFFAQAVKGVAPAGPPAAPAVRIEPATQVGPVTETRPAQPPLSRVTADVEERPEFESLNFPKDGLSRQWLEFLSQLSASK